MLVYNAKGINCGVQHHHMLTWVKQYSGHPHCFYGLALSYCTIQEVLDYAPIMMALS